MDSSTAMTIIRESQDTFLADGREMLVLHLQSMGQYANGRSRCTVTGN